MNTHEFMDAQIERSIAGAVQAPNFANDIPLSVAIAAHNGVSFTPERRGESTRNEYAETLAQDYASLCECIKDRPDMLPTLETEFARYREGYRKRYLAYLHSNSRCMSTMITGASNFPLRRMEKRNNIAHKRLNEFIEFRKRALSAIQREIQPWLKPIMAGDSDATERLQEKIADAEKFQERMRSANAAIRKHRAAGAVAQVAALVELGFGESLAQKLLLPDFAGRIGFPDYELTNNNANIRRMKARLEGISRNQATPATASEGANARYEDNPAENRVRLFFPGKPDATVRTRLKAAGFRWTPTLGCWQAYRHPHTLQTAKREAGMSMGGSELAERFAGTAPVFQAHIRALAATARKTTEAVYALWLKYAKDCESGDQSPVLFEFEQWYKDDLKPETAPAGFVSDNAWSQ